MRKKFLGQFDNNGISNWKVTRVPGTWQRGAKFELYKRDGIFVVNVFSCWCSSSLFLIKHTKRNHQFLKNEQTMSPYTVPYIVTREFNSVFRLFVFLFFSSFIFFFFHVKRTKRGEKNTDEHEARKTFRIFYLLDDCKYFSPARETEETCTMEFLIL